MSSTVDSSEVRPQTGELELVAQSSQIELKFDCK